MEIKLIKTNKKQYLDLLLLADEQEDMIDKYLERGDLFALYDSGLKSVCVVTNDNGEVEIQNLATYEEYQRQGYGRHLMNYVCDYYKKDCKTICVGTGESRITIPFYESCGFVISHRISNYFTDHYDEPMYEDGVQLVDKIYLKFKDE